MTQTKLTKKFIEEYVKHILIAGCGQYSLDNDVCILINNRDKRYITNKILEWFKDVFPNYKIVFCDNAPLLVHVLKLV